VDKIQIALGPCTDNTPVDHRLLRCEAPDIAVNVIDVPKIEAYKFGFDDARNASVAGLGTDWVLWIDTDEYLVGNIRRYLRNNYLQSYMVPQHHFTVEPRGAATQMDRPARLFRTNQASPSRGISTNTPKCRKAVLAAPICCPTWTSAIPAIRMRPSQGALRAQLAVPPVGAQRAGSERKLNHFLWLRDICHRMRFAMMQNDRKGRSRWRRRPKVL
jgi:hypothetical protein